MFKRLIIEDWTIVFPILAFFFTAAVFLYTSAHAFKLSKERREKLADLPLSDSQPRH